MASGVACSVAERALQHVASARERPKFHSKVIHIKTMAALNTFISPRPSATLRATPRRAVMVRGIASNSVGAAYAAALLDLAQSKGALEEVRKQVSSVGRYHGPRFRSR